MWKLIVMTCAVLSCSESEIRGIYKSLPECEAAMQETFETLKPGQAVMCLNDDTAIKT